MNARDMALGGVLVALTSIILYMTSVIPTSTLTILTKKNEIRLDSK